LASCPWAGRRSPEELLGEADLRFGRPVGPPTTAATGSATISSAAGANSRPPPLRLPPRSPLPPAPPLPGRARRFRWLRRLGRRDLSGSLLRHHRRRRFVHGRFALDVDAPAGELGGQAGVLPLLADGQRQLAVGNDDGAVLSSWLTLTPDTWAGLRALATKRAGLVSHWTTSMRSPPSSLTMFWIRIPRRPTHEPTGSTPSWRAETATLLR